MNSKNYTLSVKTNRYVSHACFRESISKNGLIGGSSDIIKYSKAIYAHNSSIPNYRWYPFCFDEIYNWNCDVKFNESFDDFAYQVEKKQF